MTAVPDYLAAPLDVFAADYRRMVLRGRQLLAESDVAIVGLARNCARQLEANLDRVRDLGQHAGRWRLHVETNDNEDDTEAVLRTFCEAHHEASYRSQSLGRGHYGSEFAGRRTQALAEYRTACQEWVRQECRHVDLVVVVDLDSWGGWSPDGVFHAAAALDEMNDAYGMASVSLVQMRATGQKPDGTVEPVLGWFHYDAWALRLNSYWDDYTHGQGGWKHHWLPPVGSPPVPVCSAFGGMALYRAWEYLQGTYDGSDCEHVPFHRTIAEHGSRLYLNPAMRTLMHWVMDGG